jgi:hypothetical protein
MKKIPLVLFIAGAALLSVPARGQQVGLSFSYFLPRHGYFSTPISPFSIRGLGVNLNRFVAIQTGASLYRMSGLAMKDLPLTSSQPFVGPNFTLFVPAELVFQLHGSKVQFDIKGGGFFFYGMGQKLNEGNIDNAIREKEHWDVATSTLTFQNKPGFGYHAGAELTVAVTGQLNLSLEANYLVGQSGMPLSGSYAGGQINSTIAAPTPVDYRSAKVDFSGLEFSIGLTYGGGGNAGKRKRR